MLKKILFAAVTLAAFAAATPAHASCDMSALTPGKDYSQAAYKKWTSAADKENFCLARTLLKRVKAGESQENFTMDDLPRGMARFVTPEENDEQVRTVVAYVLANGFRGKLA
jgi:hypothetical protein